jgi:hypothetical protein
MFLSRWGILGFLLSLLFIASTFIFFHSPTRNSIRAFFSPVDRKVISIAQGKIFPTGEGRVVKIQTPTGLLLEIYGPNDAGAEVLLEKIPLPDRRDALFQFRARATSLALKDLDNDDTFEIIAPSYDSALIPHLNIFRFNKDSERFEPYLE